MDQELVLPTTPLTRDEAIKFIRAQAKARGWNDNLQWLLLSVFKELGEFISAYEHLHDDRPEKRTTMDDVMGEWADVQYFLDQAAIKIAEKEQVEVSLDWSLLKKMKNNHETKKKTINEAGDIVRR